MSDLTALPNIGRTLAAQIKAAGVDSPEELAAAGSREIWLRIRANDPKA